MDAADRAPTGRTERETTTGAADRRQCRRRISGRFPEMDVELSRDMCLTVQPDTCDRFPDRQWKRAC